MPRRYTANEMREAAEVVLEFVNGDEDFVVSLASMLRQAADDLEREYESNVVQCRRCQTARSGEGFGDVPPPIGDDDICDRCKIAKRIRGNEEVVC